MMTLSDAELSDLLADDVPHGDLTTESLPIGSRRASLQFCARQAMTVCASEEVVRLFELVGASASLSLRSGDSAAAGDLILQAHGTAASLHRAWKTAQTLIECFSGVATATAAIVAAANGTPVACTRKTVPGTKLLSAKAVQAGGAIMHRMGLSETLLVFAEHRLFLDETPQQTVARLHRAQPEKKLVVEVADVAEALLWAHAGADVLQLEKFTADEVVRCRHAIDQTPALSRTLLAAAGGVRADNAASYVAAGAHLLVTSAPYTAAPKDVQVEFFALT